MSWTSLGPCASVTYGCAVDANRGLCMGQEKDKLFKHEFERAPPIVQVDKETKRLRFVGCIHFLDGKLLEAGLTGISDTDRQTKACMIPVEPNPDEQDLIGQLTVVEIADGSVWKVDGGLLTVDKAGRHLFVRDYKELSRLEAHPNPELALTQFEAPMTDAERYGPSVWQAMHSAGKLHDVKHPERTKMVMEAALQAMPCENCRKHGLDYMTKNPIPLDAFDGPARWAWTLHNQVNSHLHKRQFPWSDSLAPSKEGCSGGVCSVGHSKPEPNPPVNVNLPDGLNFIASDQCPWCSKSRESLRGIPNKRIMASERPDLATEGTPRFVLVKNGAIAKSRLGYMGHDEILAWMKEN